MARDIQFEEDNENIGRSIWAEDSAKDYEEKGVEDTDEDDEEEEDFGDEDDEDDDEGGIE